MAIDTTPMGSGTRSAHPLDALDAAEIRAAAEVLRADSRIADGALFAYFGLDEPSKDTVAGFTAGCLVWAESGQTTAPTTNTGMIVCHVRRRALFIMRESYTIPQGQLTKMSVRPGD